MYSKILRKKKFISKQKTQLEMNLKFIKQNHKEFTNGFNFIIFYYFLFQSKYFTQCNKKRKLRAQKQTLIFVNNS